MLALLVLCTAGVGLGAAWLTAPLVPVPSGSSEVAVPLPPAPASISPTANLSVRSPIDGPSEPAPSQPPPSSEPVPSELVPDPLSSLTHTAMLPLRPETKPPRTAIPPSDSPAWLRFAATASLDVRDRPRVAIVIDDLGLDRAHTERVIGLPAAVTLSFLAYSGDLPRLTETARRNGHEMIVHVPMEPVNAKIDMGPNGLSTDQPRDEVLRRLTWDLGRFDGYVGINNHMGSRFTGDAQAMGWVMGELKARGLMFLDSRTIASSIGAKAAAADGVPFAERDVFLDDDQSAAAVEQRLKEVETIARRKGTAIAIGHPHNATIDALIGWIANLPQKGIVLVPLTEVVKARLGLS
jgi:uncharacterized protein